MADFLTGEKDAWQRRHSSYSIAPCTIPLTSDVHLVPGKGEEMLSLPITLWVRSTNPLNLGTGKEEQGLASLFCPFCPQEGSHLSEEKPMLDIDF